MIIRSFSYHSYGGSSTLVFNEVTLQQNKCEIQTHSHMKLMGKLVTCWDKTTPSVSPLQHHPLSPH